MHHHPVSTMQGSYIDTGGFQGGLYGTLNYDNSSIKLHHGHYPENQDACYSGYGNTLSGSVHYTPRDPPPYSESPVYQNGYIPNSTSTYYKMAGNNDYGISRDTTGMALKTDVIDSNMTENGNVISQRYDTDNTIPEMNNVQTSHPGPTTGPQTLKLEEITEFKTDLSLQDSMSPNETPDCLNTEDIKEQETCNTTEDIIDNDSGRIVAAEDKARGNSEVKPALSYIALIAKAILESNQKRLSLGSIYSWIEKNYPYYVNKGQGWRNSVRHNLSLNDCFIKAGRCEDGKGNYWAIHPANIQDFMRGDFRQRRRSRRRGRKKDCDIGMYHVANGYIGSAAPLAPSVPFNPTPALSSIYSPYTEAERRAYRLDDALLRQNMNNPFMKWYHGNGSYSNQTPGCNSGMYGSSSPQWQPGYTDQTSYQLNAFSSRNYTAPALV
ncbi:hypothetical protein ACF0H5_014707 [Mactra antiquata]